MHPFCETGTSTLTPKHSPIMSSLNSDLLSGLFSQIREAWTERRDTTIVTRLASEYNAYADTLFDYLDYLVDLQLERRSPDISDCVTFADTLTVWKKNNLFPPDNNGREGYNPNKPKTPLPQTILRLVKTKTGLRGAEIERDTKMRLSFLSKTSQHAEHLSDSWGGEIVRRIRGAYPDHLSDREVFESWRYGFRTERQAASRSSAIDNAVPSPEEILDMCRVTDLAERAIWLRLVDETSPTNTD